MQILTVNDNVKDANNRSIRKREREYIAVFTDNYP